MKNQPKKSRSEQGVSKPKKNTEKVMARAQSKKRTLSWYSNLLSGKSVFLLFGLTLAIVLVIGLSSLNGTPSTPVPSSTRTSSSQASITNTPTKTPIPNPTSAKVFTSAIPKSLPTEFTDTKDIQMVLVPSGEFILGGSAQDAYYWCVEDLDYSGGSCDGDTLSFSFFSENLGAYFTFEDTFYLSAYFIDKFEVSNAAYKQCVNAGDCIKPNSEYFLDSAYQDHPVVNVDWNMAVDYCEWRDARLPNEAEWEKAARGPDGLRFPWGNTISSDSCKKGNVSGCYLTGPTNPTVPVDSLEDGVSVYGVFNLAGNVFEWTSSIFQPYPFDPNDGRENKNSNEDRVIRGGAWNVPTFTSLSFFRQPTDPLSRGGEDLGFRCVRDISP